MRRATSHAQVTRLTDAVDVEYQLSVDWDKLGRVFAGEHSDQQAKFLMAFHEEIKDLQLAFIGSDATIPEHVRPELGAVLRQLADRIDPAPVDAA